MAAGAVAGSLARVPTHCIDVVKARLQVETTRGARPGGLARALRTLVTREGVRGMYRWFGFTFVWSAPASCLYYATYEQTRRLLGGERGGGAGVHLASGLLAEAVACLVYVPVE